MGALREGVKIDDWGGFPGGCSARLKFRHGREGGKDFVHQHSPSQERVCGEM